MTEKEGAADMKKIDPRHGIYTSLLVSDILIVIIGGVISGLTVAISSIIGLVIKALGANLFLYIAVETKRRRVLKNHKRAKELFDLEDKNFKKSEM